MPTEGKPTVVPLFGLSFAALSLEAAADFLAKEAATRRTAGAAGPLFVATVNAEMLIRAREDAEVLGVLRQADVVVADGIGVVLAARLLGRPLPGRVAGIDLMEALLERAAAAGWPVFFLGARPEVLPRAMAAVRRRHPELVLDGHHGYFTPEEEAAVLEQIAAFRPALLFVGLGAPRQEAWIARHRPQLSAALAMGVGGSFDVLGGAVRRAPLRWQRLGLEWLWRLKEEPWRARRMAALPRFALLAVAVRLGLAREEPGRRSL
ncbi:MAG: WecB/TagA/CpsF family glycosyltransferase [Hydrogenibacillus schlegelii]|nr:WecB/TagA/CpsF family glycosyltransferase [Hydrogenibacillus schlegelii]